MKTGIRWFILIKWLIILVISSVWIEAISDNLWWILMTLVAALVAWTIAAGITEIHRQEQNRLNQGVDLTPYLPDETITVYIEGDEGVSDDRHDAHGD